MNSSNSRFDQRSQVADAEATSPMVSPTKIPRRRFLLAAAGLSVALPQAGFAADCQISFLSAADQAKVIGENAARLFGFKRS